MKSLLSINLKVTNQTHSDHTKKSGLRSSNCLSTLWHIFRDSFSVKFCGHRDFTGRNYIYAAAAKSLQSCPTLCDPMDCSLPGLSVPVPGILQARTLEWVAISFSNAWKWKVKVKSLSRVWLLATPGTAAHQAPPSMGFSGQQYWSGVPLPSPINIYIHTNVYSTCLVAKPCLTLWESTGL